jgi:hypothetical protein
LELELGISVSRPAEIGRIGTLFRWHWIILPYYLLSLENNKSTLLTEHKLCALQSKTWGSSPRSEEGSRMRNIYTHGALSNGEEDIFQIVHEIWYFSNFSSLKGWKLSSKTKDFSNND